MTDFESSRDALCWGLLYHMLGLEEAARDKLLGVGRDALYLHSVAQAALAYLDARTAAFDRRQEALEEIVATLGRVLDPHHCNGGGANLSGECERCPDDRTAKDSNPKGYSRDPLKEFKGPAPEEVRCSVALAAVAYLARAHALFAAHPKALRGFNAAKVSLNDLFQTGQLAARLYYSEPFSHLKRLSQDDYFRAVLQGPQSRPSHSAYFIWWLLELVEIQRGNIYRQIEHLEQGERHYRHAWERLERLVPGNAALRVVTLCAPDPGARVESWFITPTLIRALSERAKIQFDLGQLVESIGGDLLCLAFLIRTTKARLAGDAELELLTDLSTVLRFLESCRGQSVLDKGKITGLFTERGPEGLQPLSTDRFVPHLTALPHREKKLVSDLFARLGFALFGLRREPVVLGSPGRKDARSTATGSGNPLREWLRACFSIHEDLQGEQSALARYCSGLIDPPSQEPEGVAFTDIVERQLAQRLREGIACNRARVVPLDESDFYRALVDLATRNIDNIVTIPRRTQRLLMRPGYRARRTTGDASASTVIESLRRSLGHGTPGDAPGSPRNKLVVLRRWQSFNPRVPRPVGGAVRGGGYFLSWRGKGIVIDPGYDFIQNFYDEGFSLEDIDAVVVTHSHPDHDDDLSTLMTLAREWNSLNRYLGIPEAVKLDLFLNESTYLKFSAWLKASRVGIGRIVLMPLVVWNAESEQPTDRIRGGNTILHLDRKDGYALKLEVVPAWHDDVIGATAAVGLKFHLLDELGNLQGTVGYTGDTGAYGWPGSGDAITESQIRIEDEYSDCDLLIANLGDVRLRELSSSLRRATGGRRATKDLLGSCLDRLLEDWYWAEGAVCGKQVSPQRVAEFLGLLVDLSVPTERVLDTLLVSDPKLTVGTALGTYISTGAIPKYLPTGKELLRTLSRDVHEPEVARFLSTHVGDAAGNNLAEQFAPWQIAYSLLGFLCASTRTPWDYKYHLGVAGVFRLHGALCAREGNGQRPRIFVVSELPEELASYRHHMARLLNVARHRVDHQAEDQRSGVFAFTGDIGLHIGLTDTVRRKWELGIRCTYCNYNNESVLRGESYHLPHEILETSIKRLGSAMVYLCTKHDHHPENESLPNDYLVSPSLRSV